MTILGQKAPLSTSNTQLFKDVTPFPPYSSTNKGILQRQCHPLSLLQHGTFNPTGILNCLIAKLNNWTYNTCILATSGQHTAGVSDVLFCKFKVSHFALVSSKATCINSSFLEEENWKTRQPSIRAFQREFERDFEAHRKGGTLSSHICI